MPGDKRQAATDAVAELQQALKGVRKDAGEMKCSPSMTKRKRSGAARVNSAKTIKAEPMA